MTKYMNRQPLSSTQESEIYPILDAAIQLPFGKAIIYPCSKKRAIYLSNYLQGEQYRNAIISVSTYPPEHMLYGKGLYYNLVIEPRDKGVLVANLMYPPDSITWQIIRCFATKKPVPITEPPIKVNSRLNKLKERYPELKSLYVSPDDMKICRAIATEEELFVVDIDPGVGNVPRPTPEVRAKSRQ